MRSSPRTWLVPLSALILVALFVADLRTRDDTVLVALYALGPLLALLGGGPRAVAGIGGLALALAVAHSVDDETSTTAQDVVRIATVAFSSLLAVWIAGLRERARRTTGATEEELGFLTAVFERAPVGIALLDTDLHFVRVNDHITEINGVPAAEHVGRTISDVLPGLPPEVEADAAEVVRTGRRVSQMEVVGSTPAQPGATRHWIVSYWPVRTLLSDELVGVGIVVDEVTERRAAERALRAQTNRYEALLLAISEAGEGLVVLERDGRCVYANAAFEQLSGYTFPELAAMDSVLDLVVDDEREDARRRAAARIEQGAVESALALTLRRRDGATLDLEVGGVPLDVEGRHQLVVVVRDVSERRRAEAEREALLRRSALVAEASELFDQSLNEERTMDSVARLCVRELADTCVILLGSEPGRVRRVAVVARDGVRERELTGALLHDPLEERGDHAVLEAMAAGTAAVTEAPAGLGTRALTVALRARGRTHGVLVAGFDALPARDELELLALFEDLGRRAALALDNARLYEERDQVARTLQRSLLPSALPEIPGVEIAARYVAGGRGQRGRWRLLRLLRHRRGRLGRRDRRRVRQGHRGRHADRARPLHAAGRRRAHPAPAGGARRAQRGASAPAPRLPLLHRALHIAHPARGPRRRRGLHGRPPTAARAAGGRRGGDRGRAGNAARDRRRPGDLRAADRARARRCARALHGRRDGHDGGRPHYRRPPRGVPRDLRGERRERDRRGGRARCRQLPGRAAARRRRRGRRPRPRPPRRVVWPDWARGSGIVVKLLVVTPEPVDADMLRATLGDEVEGAEVLVVAPATNQSKLAFWVSDPDEAIHEAEVAEEETVERLEEEGIDAAGDTGESEPVVAIQDALATFRADRILIFSHPDLDYREDKDLEAAEERFGVPVTHAQIAR